MRAVVMRAKRLVVAQIPLPEPGPGEVLVKTLACGICGSDLHALKHGEAFVEASRRAGSIFTMDLGRDVVMGHEFCAEIVAHGPETRRQLPAGTRVCSMPGLVRRDGIRSVGYSNETPGGYAEYMRLTESWLLPVPDGLATAHAALTEPMAVGVPGVLDQIMAAAPRGTRIVVVGVCMEPDTIQPMLGISKELNLQFVLAYTADEFAATLRHIADGAIPTAPLVTGTVGVEGVARAFEELGSPERHAKILVEPWRS